MYYAAVDSLTTVEALIVQATASLTNSETLLYPSSEGVWTTIEANLAKLESTKEIQTEDIYQLEPIWQWPVGQAAKGIDAFKILCHINCLKEVAAIVMGDSGAVLMLILEIFLKGLKWLKPKPRLGQKLELIQLTVSTGCSKYVKLKLYFCSQFGLSVWKE